MHDQDYNAATECLQSFLRGKMKRSQLTIKIKNTLNRINKLHVKFRMHIEQRKMLMLDVAQSINDGLVKLREILIWDRNL